MKVVLTGSPLPIFNELSTQFSMIFVDRVSEFSTHKDADLFINMNPESADENYEGLPAVLVNSVAGVLKPGSEKITRFNGWEGFTERTLWEMAGNRAGVINEFMDHIGKKVSWCKDEPGFISARILAMIINEGFFAVEEQVSTRDEIDIAMKLGTSYPYGPFEWCKIIGPAQIMNLLKTLETTDTRYRPSQLLINEAVSV